MEYLAEELIPDNKEKSHQLLTPEVTVHVEGKALDIDEPPAKKRKKKVAELKWKRTSKFVKAKKCTLEANISLDIPENASPLLIFEMTTKLNELVKRIRYNDQIGAFLGINYIMSISKLPNVKCDWSGDS